MPRPRARDIKKPPRKKKLPPRNIGIEPGENEVPFPRPVEGPGEPPGPGGEAPPVEDAGIPGLPPEVAARIDQIIRQYPGEAGQKRAIQWLMTTTWFKQEYAGYDVGFAKGQFSDPFSGGLAQHRAYKSELQRIHRQYYNRDLTVDEVTGYINQGYDPGRVERMGQGHATVQANQGEWQYLSGAYGGGMLSEEEKKAYGEQQAGIDSELGQRIKTKVETALQRMQRVFQGTTASSGEFGLGQAQKRRQQSDIQY